MHETHEEILELYENEQIQQDPRNQNLTKKWKNLIKKKQNKNTVGSRLIKILDNINDNKRKTNNKILDKKKFDFPFGDDITEEQLTEFFIFIIN